MAEVDLKRLPTHLTDEQIQLLNDSWVLIESNYELHGRQIFLTFFEDNPEYLEYFDFRAGFSENLKENKMLGAHVINVMNSIASLVKFGTKDDLLMFCSLTRIVQKHKHIKGKDVRGQDVQVLGAALRKHFATTFKSAKTSALDEALSILMNRVAIVFDKF